MQRWHPTCISITAQISIITVHLCSDTPIFNFSPWMSGYMKIGQRVRPCNNRVCTPQAPLYSLHTIMCQTCISSFMQVIAIVKLDPWLYYGSIILFVFDCLTVLSGTQRFFVVHKFTWKTLCACAVINFSYFRHCIHSDPGRVSVTYNYKTHYESGILTQK